jgi:hypothetical protein
MKKTQVIIKMSADLEWLIDKLDDNIIVELQGETHSNELKIILEIPINNGVIERLKERYDIDYLGWNEINIKPKHYYKIKYIGE